MDALKKIRDFLGLGKSCRLSDFQKRKLLHEFHTFYDINKDGRLQWKDFELARDYICSKSGWQRDSPRWNQCRELFIELWRNLQDTADENMDGEVTVDEWLQMWTKIQQDAQDSPGSRTSRKPNRSDNPPETPAANKDDSTSSQAGGDQLLVARSQFPDGGDEAGYLPAWFNRYVEYKFNLLDRAGDGIMDEEEFEFTLSDGFDISPNDCRIAYRIFTRNGEEKVDFAYFYKMALQYYLSDNPSDLGNFINGKLHYDE